MMARGALRSISRSAGLLALMLAACDRQPAMETAVVEVASEPTLEEWRQQRDASLRRSDGWLTLVGLHWLEEGANTLGSDPANDLQLSGAAPARVGVLRRNGSVVEIEADPGAEILHQGAPVETLVLQADITGEPTVLTVGSLSLFVIERGERVGIRVKDSASEVLASFTGMEYFEVDPEWRIDARFETYDPPREIEVPNILGTVSIESAPGAVVFEHGGQTFRLEPTGDPAEGLFLVFGDRTNGDETYGGGRFLTTMPPRNGRVIVDFNRAYNPPCVFTPYATCPLPAPGNRLPVRVAAGEKMFGGGH